eukprot:CAMPEP_0194027708 /NCGR_PEP_ID=MMETSP0009_2-20130614/1804_1 /TAXON_ID=210454 /ORGANISM="Grammatophora oceanica, Strain CCMP 410" /LENGTH=362 /DNA_ID=CAMNT_0038666859 /DNA_START=298 /DNA_END=1386 /DNA_ORIENTATION=-
MCRNLSEPTLLVEKCLPQGSPLTRYLCVGTSVVATEETTASELESRIWTRNEDPDLLRAYLVSEVVPSDTEPWWRTKALVRALLATAIKDRNNTRAAIEKAAMTKTDDEDAMDESPPVVTEDVLGVTIENFVRYKTVVLAVLEQDGEDSGGTSANSEAALLKSAKDCFDGDDDGMLACCVESLLQNEIVSIQGILAFCFESGCGITQWWELASTCFQVAFEAFKETTQQESGFGGIMLDTTGGDDDAAEGDKTMEKAEQLIKWAEPLVQSVVEQVYKALSQVESSSKNKFTAQEVDLVEGLKRFLLSIKSFVVSELTTTEREARSMWDKSEMSATRLLASKTSSSASAAAELLDAILEQGNF